MLSDHERRELSLIEQGLGEDRSLAASLGRRPGPQRRWPIRLLVCIGILLMLTGMLAGAGDLFLQGLLATSAGVGWHRWRAWRPTV